MRPTTIPQVSLISAFKKTGDRTVQEAVGRLRSSGNAVWEKLIFRENGLWKHAPVARMAISATRSNGAERIQKIPNAGTTDLILIIGLLALALVARRMKSV